VSSSSKKSPRHHQEQDSCIHQIPANKDKVKSHWEVSSIEEAHPAI
jgi:hypothetical protein